MTVLSGATGERRVQIERLSKEIARAWRRSRPKLMQQYDELDQTDRRIAEAAERWWVTMNDLERQGMPHDQADNLARYEWIYLPDIDEDE